MPPTDTTAPGSTRRGERSGSGDRGPGSVLSAVHDDPVATTSDFHEDTDILFCDHPLATLWSHARSDPERKLRVATQAGLFPPARGDSRTLVSGFRVALIHQGRRVPSGQTSR